MIFSSSWVIETFVLANSRAFYRRYDKKCYKGSCETTFKKRFANHRKSFNNDQYKNETELSKEV